MATHASRLSTALRGAGLSLLLALATHAAHAVLITFDERPWRQGDYEPDDWINDPITDEYAALGVHISGGFLQRATGGPFESLGTGQFLIGGSQFSISFSGSLPQYVSLDFRMVSPPGETYVTAHFSGGGSQTARSGGLQYGGPDVGWFATPYTVFNHASFHGNGISSLEFAAFDTGRFTGYIDNLYFGNVPAVPEPSSIALALSGALVMAGVALGRGSRRRKLKFLPTS